MDLMASPVDLHSQHDHVKHLLDQRAARADLHARFPSLSEFSDSPSVYSHAHFSPRSHFEGAPQPFALALSAHHSPSLSEPRSPTSELSDRERLQIPNASSLDLDDDPRSSTDYGNNSEDDSISDNERDEEIPRISMYGPKMRFHSPAPWEMDEDGEDSSSSSKQSEKKLFAKPETNKRGWALPRMSSDTRPSGESIRSKAKPSFEGQSNTLSPPSNGGSALAALAQASMSSTSLALHNSPQQTLRDKLSLPRLRTRASNIGPLDTISPANISPLQRIISPPDSSRTSDDRSISSALRSDTPSSGEYTHPYANPEVIRMAAPPPSPSLSTFASRGDSHLTLTDTTGSSSMSQFRSTSTLSITPVTSMSSVSPSMNEPSSPITSRGNSKGISGPIAVNKPLLAGTMLNGLSQSPMTPVNNMNPLPRRKDSGASSVAMGGYPVWHDTSGGGSSFKLISLEEAQAQARERSRSATSTQATLSMISVDSDAESRSRGRTTSASGGRPKFSTDAGSRYASPSGAPGDSPVSNVPPKQVGRKKSGFMRLFNKDRASPPSPPPIPVHANDGYPFPSHNGGLQPLLPPQMPSSRPRAGSVHRVPVPTLSPTLTFGGDDYGRSSPRGSPLGSSGSSGSNEMRDQQQQHLTVRRKAPDLTIVTSPTIGGLNHRTLHPAPLSAGSGSDMTHRGLTPTLEVRPDGPPEPNSAPSSKTQFVGLSLRPVSTLFTRELKTQLTGRGSLDRPSLEADTGTPTTATTANTSISPLSADFQLGKGYHDKAQISLGHDSDQSAVIQALQEQIVSAKRAWQRQIWELEGQVRDLKAEVEELRTGEGAGQYCATCGRGPTNQPSPNERAGVVNRPRARTGTGSRFAGGV